MNKLFQILLFSLFSLFGSGSAMAGGNTSIVNLSEVHSVKVEEGRITIVGSGFVVFRAMTDKEHQTGADQVFGQPAQTVRMRVTQGTFEIIPYFTDPGIKGVPTGGHSAEALKQMSGNWWADMMKTYKTIKVGDSISIGYQEDRITLSGFQVQSIVGAGGVEIHPKPDKQNK